jgi:hypothetical protein
LKELLRQHSFQKLGLEMPASLSAQARVKFNIQTGSRFFVPLAREYMQRGVRIIHLDNQRLHFERAVVARSLREFGSEAAQAIDQRHMDAMNRYVNAAKHYSTILDEQREEFMVRRILKKHVQVAVVGDDHAKRMHQHLPGFTYIELPDSRFMKISQRKE